MKTITHQLLLTRQQAAEALNVSESTIKRLCKRGLLKAVKGIWRCRIPKVEIDRFITDSLATIN